MIEEVHIRFQGGFAGKESFLEGSEKSGQEYVRLTDIFPEDSNSLQISSIFLTQYYFKI